MAHNLISLLGGNTSSALALQDLRAMTKDGVDVRLIADILAKAHTVMRQLGLDPVDTTPQEVYSSLMNAVRTEQWLALLQETEYVLIDIDGRIISFNPIDVVNNYHHELPIEKQQTVAGKRGLGWEITKRYKTSPKTNDKKVVAVAERANWPTEEPQFCSITFGKPSILAIGDIATEALITLEKGSVDITGSAINRKLTFALGAKISTKDAVVQDAVGAAANAAVAFSRLGVQPSLMSWLGNDTVGRSTLQYLRESGVDMSGVAIEKYKRTNYHYVLRHGAERTILANYENYDYRWREPACKPDWVYLTMISGDSWELHESLVRYLSENPSVKLAFQPGATHVEWGAKKLKDIYSRSDVVIMNIDEAMAVTGLQVRNSSSLLRRIHELGAKTVVITNGPKGAYAFDGKKTYEMPSFPDPEKPTDRTGAGDAFASTLVAELAKGESLENALLRAPINSMNVVQKLGAQAGLLTSREIAEHVSIAPKDYVVRVIK